MRRGSVKLSITLPCLLFLFSIQAMQLSSAASLQVGYYDQKCPNAEAMVRKVVRKALAKDPGLGAGLIRMLFHDCFVRGCDASVLLESTRDNSPERMSSANNPSLRGFEVIGDAKNQLERHCPETVSCADILAFAARDSAYYLGRIQYSVPSGRRDGTISMESDVLKNLPSPFSNLTTLENKFAKKGLSLSDLVALSAAHSIGRFHCSSFSQRLFNFSSTTPQDPSIDPAFAAFLKARCPNLNGSSVPVPPSNDPDIVISNRLDNEYYKNLYAHRVLLPSDQALLSSPQAMAMVNSNAMDPKAWSKMFAAAMVKLSSTDVLVGTQGEIRKKCNLVNVG